jgi:hypothetical protein
MIALSGHVHVFKCLGKRVVAWVMGRKKNMEIWCYLSHCREALVFFFLLSFISNLFLVQNYVSPPCPCQSFSCSLESFTIKKKQKVTLHFINDIVKRQRNLWNVKKCWKEKKSRGQSRKQYFGCQMTMIYVLCQ